VSSPTFAVVPDPKPKPTPWPPMSGDVSEYLRTPPPPLPWFARDRLLADRAHVLTGVGGSGKTRSLYHLGIGAIVGRLPWGWEIERTGAAALFLTEDAPGNVHRTLAALVAHGGFRRDEIQLIGERLRVYPLAGQQSRLLSLESGGVLVETSCAAGLFKTCTAIPDLRFVGLDPAIGLSEGDEGNPAHQRRLGELADRLALETGTCVVLSSHAAKALQAADEAGSHSSRGSGAITDAVRAEFVLRTMTAAEARTFGIAELEVRKSHVQLVATKGNELPPEAFAPVWLRRGFGGVLELANLTPAEVEPVGRRELAALAALRKLAAVAAPLLKDWRQACAEAGLLTGENFRAQERSMERIRDALVSAGLVERGTGRGVFLPAAQA
jgi:AAA domain-containing protein